MTRLLCLEASPASRSRRANTKVRARARAGLCDLTLACPALPALPRSVLSAERALPQGVCTHYFLSGVFLLRMMARLASSSLSTIYSKVVFSGVLPTYPTYGFNNLFLPNMPSSFLFFSVMLII